MNEKEFLKRGEVAELIGITTRHLHTIRTNDQTFPRPGRTGRVRVLFWRRADVIQWMDEGGYGNAI